VLARWDVPSSGDTAAIRAGLRVIYWLVLNSWNRLHAVSDDSWDNEEEEVMGTGEAACGASGIFVVPGVLSRLGLPRCAHCCDRLSVPRGKGDPINGG
jgi:hypothetical protein